VPTASNTVPTASNTVPTASNVVPTASYTVPTASNTVPTASNTLRPRTLCSVVSTILKSSVFRRNLTGGLGGGGARTGGQMAGICENGNECSCPIKCGKFMAWLSNC